MTPEEAAYHRVMLLAGLRDGYDLALDSALENENPLSGLIVNLAFCVPDTEKTISVLYNYILDNPPDDRRVFSLVMEDFRNRYLSKSMTEVQICDKMCDVVNKLGKGLDEPWYELVVLSDDCSHTDKSFIVPDTMEFVAITKDLPQSLHTYRCVPSLR